MDWFQHSTDSHDDPDISDAEDRFGDAGYNVFFKVLEVYGREFNKLDPEGFLRISQGFLRKKLRKSSGKVQEILNFFSERKRMVIKIDGDFISIQIPRFLELSSNWTKRKLQKEQQQPTEVPTEVPTAKEEEEEEEEKKNKELSPDVLKFTDQAISSIFENMGNLAPRPSASLLKNSADTIDKLIRIDGFDLDYIKKVVEWAMNDDFWKKNVLSLASLRNKGKNQLTKFQNMANGFENWKRPGIPKRTENNIRAAQQFIEKINKGETNG